jgi:hypothetical protein
MLRNIILRYNSAGLPSVMHEIHSGMKIQTEKPRLEIAKLFFQMVKPISRFCRRYSRNPRHDEFISAEAALAQLNATRMSFGGAVFLSSEYS